MSTVSCRSTACSQQVLFSALQSQEPTLPQEESIAQDGRQGGQNVSRKGKKVADLSIRYESGKLQRLLELSQGCELLGLWSEGQWLQAVNASRCPSSHNDGPFRGQTCCWLCQPLLLHHLDTTRRDHLSLFCLLDGIECDALRLANGEISKPEDCPPKRWDCLDKAWEPMSLLQEQTTKQDTKHR